MILIYVGLGITKHTTHGTMITETGGSRGLNVGYVYKHVCGSFTRLTMVLLDLTMVVLDLASRCQIWHRPCSLIHLCTFSWSGWIQFLGEQNIEVPWDVANLKYYIIRAKHDDISHPAIFPTTNNQQNLDQNKKVYIGMSWNRILIFWKIKWNQKVKTSSRYRISIFIQYGPGYQVEKIVHYNRKYPNSECMQQISMMMFKS